MGSGSSNTSSSWTKEEEEQNKKAVELQHCASEYVVEHMYYGVPTKMSKKIY